MSLKILVKLGLFPKSANQLGKQNVQKVGGGHFGGQNTPHGIWQAPNIQLTYYELASSHARVASVKGQQEQWVSIQCEVE